MRLREIELQSLFWRARKLGTSMARFRRVNEGCRTMHHDALELPGGKIVLLTVSAGRSIRNCNSVTSDQPPTAVAARERRRLLFVVFLPLGQGCDERFIIEFGKIPSTLNCHKIADWSRLARR